MFPCEDEVDAKVYVKGNVCVWCVCVVMKKMRFEL